MTNDFIIITITNSLEIIIHKTPEKKINRVSTEAFKIWKHEDENDKERWNCNS